MKTAGENSCLYLPLGLRGNLRDKTAYLEFYSLSTEHVMHKHILVEHTEKSSSILFTFIVLCIQGSFWDKRWWEEESLQYKKNSCSKTWDALGTNPTSMLTI